MYIGGYPRQFKYYRASSLSHALELLSEMGEEGKVIAGGQSLMPMMRLRMSFLNKLIDIYRINELRYVKVDGNTLRIGALTAHQEIAMDPTIARNVPTLTRAAWTIADLQVRNRGTIGGSLAHADPAANYLPALMVADAELLIVDKAGQRRVKLSNFMLDSYTTDIKPSELVAEVSIPLGRYNAFGYSILKRGGNAFPIVIAAVAAKVVSGIVNEARLGVGGITAKPLLMELNDIEGKPIEDALNYAWRSIDALIDESIKGTRLLSDIHASDRYRLGAAKSFSLEAVKSALGGLS